MFLAWWTTLLGRLRRRPRHPDWSFSFEMVIRYLRIDWEETADWDLRRLRVDMNQRPYPKDFAKKVTIECATVGGVSTVRFVPPNPNNEAVIMYLHGGGYVFGSPRSTHEEFIARLSFETGLPVVAPEYRLAPEHPYPAQLEDAASCFSALVEAATPPERIILVGDSAGGNLAIALQLALRDQGRTQAAAAVLVSPWSDLEMPAGSFEENDPYDFGTREVLVKHATAFAGGLPFSDPRLSLTRADLSGLAPCMVIMGELELPRDDIHDLAKKLEQAGVDTTVHWAKAMPHTPPVFAAFHAEGLASFEAMTAFIGRHLAPK